jgi:PilZ domain
MVVSARRAAKMMTQAIQRRDSDRAPVTSIVRVRRPEIQLAGGQRICTTSNSSRNGVYFVAESLTLLRKVQLFLSFPHHADPSSLSREYLAEVVRVDSLPGGYSGIAARLLHNIQLRLRDGLIVPETGFWMNWPHETPQLVNFYA